MENVLPSAPNVERRFDGFRKTRKKRCEADGKRCKCAPIYTNIVVTIDTIAFVELVDVQFAFLDEIIVAWNEDCMSMIAHQ